MKKGPIPVEGIEPGIATADSTAKARDTANNYHPGASERHSAANDQTRTNGPTGRERLPQTISGRLSLVFERERLSPQKSRLLKYIFRHPDAWTHEIAANAAVGYPPNRLGELNKEVMWRYGLAIHCHAPEQWLTNRYGDESKVHQWRLILQPVADREAA